MVQINFAKGEVQCKVVYYGPARSGKTANLRSIHERSPESIRGQLTTIATDTNRTLFFDFTSLDLGVVAGIRTKVHLYAIPYIDNQNAMRLLVLEGVDGIVFVADAASHRLEANREALENLRQNLAATGRDLTEVPMVIQWNKTDHPDATPIEDLEKALNPEGFPSFAAAAEAGTGVFSTLKAATQAVLVNVAQVMSSAPAPSVAAAEPREPLEDPGLQPLPVAVDADDESESLPPVEDYSLVRRKPEPEAEAEAEPSDRFLPPWRRPAGRPFEEPDESPAPSADESVPLPAAEASGLEDALPPIRSNADVFERQIEEVPPAPQPAVLQVAEALDEPEPAPEPAPEEAYPEEAYDEDDYSGYRVVRTDEASDWGPESSVASSAGAPVTTGTRAPPRMVKVGRRYAADDYEEDTGRREPRPVVDRRRRPRFDHDPQTRLVPVANLVTGTVLSTLSLIAIGYLFYALM